MFRMMIVAAMVAAPVVTAAQEMDAADRAASQEARTAQRAGRYLAAERLLRARAFDGADKPRPGFIYDQWSETIGVLTGTPARDVTPPGSTAATLDESDPAVAKIAAQARRATPRDAIAAIVERAKATRLVILNEDHGSPRDRAFALEVARALRPLGYDLFGAETFVNDADPAKAKARMRALAADGYPRQTSGYYTRDPVFGDLVRQALALGYRPFAYETTNEDRSGDWPARIARRETDQATTIARVLAANPTSKAFVYVGYSHAAETPIPGDDGEAPTVWMAARVKGMTGIDPLTIEQTTMNDSGAGNASLYGLVRSRLGQRPVVLLDGTTPILLGLYRGHMDLQVVHPPLTLTGGRPVWLTAMGRTPTPIPAQYLPKTGTRLVQAFVADEADDAIPVDQVLVTAGETPPVLMLPKAPVRFAVQD